MSEFGDKLSQFGYKFAASLHQSIRQNPQLASRDLHREVITSPRWLSVNSAINTVRGAETQFDGDGYVYEYDYYLNLVGYKLELFDYYLGQLRRKHHSGDVNSALNARRAAVHDDLIGRVHEYPRASRAAGGEGNFENFLALFAREITRAGSPTNVDEGFYADQIKFGNRFIEPGNYWGDQPSQRMRARMAKMYDALLVFNDRFEYRQFISHVVEEASLPLFNTHEDFWGAALHLERQVFGLTGYAMHEPLMTAAGNVIAQGKFFDHMPDQDEIDQQIASGDKGAPFDQYDE